MASDRVMIRWDTPYTIKVTSDAVELINSQFEDIDITRTPHNTPRLPPLPSPPQDAMEHLELPPLALHHKPVFIPRAKQQHQCQANR